MAMGFKDNFNKKINDTEYEKHLMKNYVKRRQRAEERANAYSYFLAAVCAIIAVVFVIYGSFALGLIFMGAGALLVLLVYLTKRQDKKEAEKNKEN